MWEYRHSSPNKLSGGQKQRVAIAGVVAMHPKCIVLDEPTSVLTPSGVEGLFDAIRNLTADGKTIIFISHKLKEVFALDETRPLRRMSKCQQKQAAFWLAMCAMPDYLILDEPVDGLDPVMRRQVWSLILQDVAERGTTVLVSSHNLRELEDVCDHVGVMSRGKLLLEHSLSELQDYTVKLQLAFEGTELPELPQEIKVLHHAQTGRVHTLICRGSAEELEQQLAALHPIFIDAVPLSLEEIFIYELGGEDYAIRDIVL